MLYDSCMKKTCLIIINGYGIADGVKNQVSRLSEELLKRDIDFEIKKNTEILAFIENGNLQSKLKHYDFVIYLDKDKFIARMLEKLNYRVFNNAESIELCDDKMLTHIALSNNNLKMPTTISSALCFRDDGNREYLNEISAKLGFPLIIKENYGSLGKQVYLVNNFTELQQMEDKLIHVPHIFQKYIKSSKGKDYRIIVIGGKVVAHMKRENKHSYLSNLAAGGSASVVELPSSYLNTAIKAAEILKLDYCGVDILEGENGEPIISEVNSNAFYEGIEKITGINVAGKYVDYIIGKLF